MNALEPRSSGVSGAQAPEQGAPCLFPTGNKTLAQSCDEKKKRAQQLRVYLPDHQFQRYKDKSPKDRTRAVAAILGSVEVGIDLGKLIEATDELRRLGILLNQVLRLAHQDRVTIDFVERVEAVVQAVEALKP